MSCGCEKRQSIMAAKVMQDTFVTVMVMVTLQMVIVQKEKGTVDS